MIAVAVAMRAQRRICRDEVSPSSTRMALSGIASTTCSASQSGSIGERSLCFRNLLDQRWRAARVQFFDLSAAMPCLARASSAAPPAAFSAGISTRKVSFTSAFSAISAP